MAPQNHRRNRDPREEFDEWFNSEDGQGVKKLMILYAELGIDAIISRSHVETDVKEYAIRQYVRAVFAMIEGTIYVMKQLARNSIEKLSAAELALIAEELYDLNDKGEPIIRPNYLKLEKNIKFAFSIYAKSVGLTYTLPVHESGWNSLKQSIKLRNRLMHPKKFSDLDVTDDEFNSVVATHEWFDQKYKELQVLMMDQIHRNQGFSSEEILKIHEEYARIYFKKFGKEHGQKLAAESYGEAIAEKIAAEYEEEITEKRSG